MGIRIPVRVGPLTCPLKCLPAGSWDMTFEIIGAGVLLKGQDIKKTNSATLVHTVLRTLVHAYVGLYFGA